MEHKIKYDSEVFIYWQQLISNDANIFTAFKTLIDKFSNTNFIMPINPCWKTYLVTIKFAKEILVICQSSLNIFNIRKIYENWMLMNKLAMSIGVACPELFFENSKFLSPISHFSLISSRIYFLINLFIIVGYFLCYFITSL